MSPRRAAGPGAPAGPSHIVTFCNCGRAVFGLLDPGGVRVVEIDTSTLGRPVGGTVGVALAAGRCYVAIQTHPAAVAVFGPGWTLERFIEPDEVRDIHGLAVLGDDLLVVSTAANQIVALDLASGAVRPFWTAEGALADSEHVNDVCVAGDRVLACRFGPRRPGGLRRGQVFDARTGAVLVANLREPHSVAVDVDGTVHVLESPSGDLVRCPDGFPPRRAHGIVGYARGLAMGPATIAIGKSGYRRQSRSGIGEARQAPLAPNEASQVAAALSGVFLIDRGRGGARFVDTSAIGPEVYALAALPDLSASPPRRRR